MTSDTVDTRRPPANGKTITTTDVARTAASNPAGSRLPASASRWLRAASSESSCPTTFCCAADWALVAGLARSADLYMAAISRSLSSLRRPSRICGQSWCTT